MVKIVSEGAVPIFKDFRRVFLQHQMWIIQLLRQTVCQKTQ